MQELSLNILDIAENSVAAGATQVVIGIVYIPGPAPLLTITITDDGHGMDEDTVRRVADPFYTTRTTRKVGMGTALFKQAAELTGGSFSVQSRLGIGTVVTAAQHPDHLDAVPLGDVAATYAALVQTSPEMEFVLRVCRKGADPQEFVADTAQFREILQGVPLNSAPVVQFISDYVRENLAQTLGEDLFL